ncbi:hypothetical protein CMO91_00520 [Candidatus Woesearchaeota archaeon]|nr:hypothetical protein [Candidatus Woesearchaeota archaeon]|tara:strand:+ start:83 stop:490 length:408 start_codon:yes stop_codon:yes gene_type:complete
MPRIAVGIVLLVAIASLYVTMDSPTGAQVYAPYASGGSYEPYQYDPRYSQYNQHYQPRVSPYYNAYNTDPYRNQYGSYSSLGYNPGRGGQSGFYRGYYDYNYPALRQYSPYSYSGYTPYRYQNYNQNYDYLWPGY